MIRCYELVYELNRLMKVEGKGGWPVKVRTPSGDHIVSGAEWDAENQCFLIAITEVPA